MSLGLVPFTHYFPEQGAAETRVLTVSGHPTVPDDEYALFEAYCDDPRCDCRRCMLNVVSRRLLRPVASISYGFDRAGEHVGPFLDPLNPQSSYAEAMLALVIPVLADAAYRARLEKHYRQVKEAVAPLARPIEKRPSLPSTGPGRAQRRSKKKRKR